MLLRRQQDDEQVCLTKLSFGLSRRQSPLSRSRGPAPVSASPRPALRPRAGVYRATYYGTDLELLGDDEIEIGRLHIDRARQGRYAEKDRPDPRPCAPHPDAHGAIGEFGAISIGRHPSAPPLR